MYLFTIDYIMNMDFKKSVLGKMDMCMLIPCKESPKVDPIKFKLIYIFSCWGGVHVYH